MLLCVRRRWQYSRVEDAYRGIVRGLALNTRLWGLVLACLVGVAPAGGRVWVGAIVKWLAKESRFGLEMNPPSRPAAAPPARVLGKM